MQVMAGAKVTLDDWKRHIETDCPATHKGALLDVFRDHLDTFSFRPGGATGFTHFIDTVTVAPIHSCYRPMTQAKHMAVEKHLLKLSAMGIIEPADQCPWSSPMVVVIKPDGDTRLCMDLREVNKVTKPDRYPMPQTEDILSRLGGAHWFSTWDLEKGFYHILMDEVDKQKTAFSTHMGMFWFRVMLFGLRNALATFQRMMNKVLGAALYKWVESFSFDTVVYSKTIEEHITHLRDVLD